MHCSEPSGSVVSPRHSTHRLGVTQEVCHVSGTLKGGAGGYGHAVEGTDPASLKARIMLRRLWIGMSALLSSVAPVFGEVSLVRSHSVMAARS